MYNVLIIYHYVLQLFVENDLIIKNMLFFSIFFVNFFVIFLYEKINVKRYNLTLLFHAIYSRYYVIIAVTINTFIVISII